jgi:hypothetical protein
MSTASDALAADQAEALAPFDPYCAVCGTWLLDGPTNGTLKPKRRPCPMGCEDAS